MSARVPQVADRRGNGVRPLAAIVRICLQRVVVNTNVMPAQAGTQVIFRQGTLSAPGQRALAARRARGGQHDPLLDVHWVPAFAGMTSECAAALSRRAGEMLYVSANGV